MTVRLVPFLYSIKTANMYTNMSTGNAPAKSFIIGKTLIHTDDLVHWNILE